MFFLKSYIRKITDKNVFYLLTIPTYFIFHNWTIYRYVVDFGNLSGYIIFWLLLPFLIYPLFKLVYPQKPVTASILSIIVLIFFFFYGPLYNALFEIPFFHFFLKTSTTFLLILIFIISTIIFRKKLNLEKSKFPRFLITLFIVLTCYDIISALFFKSPQQNFYVLKNDFDTAGINFSRKPDIYFFIFDEHVDLDEKLYGKYGMLPPTDDDLKKRGLIVHKKSYAAYIYTAFSISSVFCGSVFKHPHKKKIDLGDYLLALHQLQKNPVIPIFINNDYEIINTSGYPIHQKENYKLLQTPFGSINQIILHQTFPNKYLHLLKLALVDRLLNTPMAGWLHLDDMLQQQKMLVSTQKSVIQAAYKPSVKPKLVYAHFFVPHFPLLLDSNLQTLSLKNYLKAKRENNPLGNYMKNLWVANKMMLQLVDTIKNSGTKEKIIIIQSDHGLRTDDLATEEMYNVFSAYAIPENFPPLLKDTFFTPNTFRVLFQTLSSKKMEMVNLEMINLKSN